MADYDKQIKKLLSTNGYEFYRHGKGSHDIWMHKERNFKITLSKNIKGKAYANRLLKEAGIDHKF